MSIFKRATSGSIVCPQCGRLVGVQDKQCLGCGRTNPGLWGFAPLVNRLGQQLDFEFVVRYGCILLFGISLFMGLNEVNLKGFFSFLSPGGRPLLILGMSGATPVFEYGRWWTVLSAAWLHGGALHLVLNIIWIRRLSDIIKSYFSFSQLFIIYTVASATGFLLSSVMALFPFLPGPLRGAYFTVGASAPLFGLFGALVFAGRRTGNRALADYGRQFVIIWLAIGFLLGFGDALQIRIDNWAHLGGFAGGYAVAVLLDPNQDRPENPKHVMIGIACIVMMALSIIVSIVDAYAG